METGSIGNSGFSQLKFGVRLIPLQLPNRPGTAKAGTTGAVPPQEHDQKSSAADGDLMARAQELRILSRRHAHLADYIHVDLTPDGSFHQAVSDLCSLMFPSAD